jgi:phosphatidylserine decarboxylase
MIIHKEGKRSILVAFYILILINLPIFVYANIPLWLKILILVATLIPVGIVIRFFRDPQSEKCINSDAVYSVADGEVVVIEEVNEEKFLHEKRIQISVFMSVNNVHINWFPVSGKITKVDYYSGKFMLARNPKSSFLNEHTSVVIQPENRDISILVRQIAGFVARRIVCYAREGADARQSTQLGFIKFGSRVDVLLPLDAEIKVKIGDKVKGGITELARFKSD